MELSYLPLPGTPKERLDTPCLVIDLPTMERNIQKMADFFRDRECKLRPHAKTHKCPILAHKQVEAGAIGICCAKVGEAEAMVLGGVKDIFIANQVVGPTKIARLMALCRYADIKVAVDDPANVRELSEAAQAHGVNLGVLVEVNVRINRCGVEPGQPAVELARLVASSPGLAFKGLMGYEGQIRIPDFEQRAIETRKAMQKLLDTKEALERAGLPVEIVSAGSTSTYNITGSIPGITEVEAGTYIFMDAAYRYIPDFDCALTLLATVISRPRKGVAIIDAGMKALSTDEGMPEVVWPRGAKLTRLSEEHGAMQVEGDAEQLRPGDKVEILPSHGDTTINLHTHYFPLRNGILEAVWEISGRGRFR
jgi:D-serine deaminase-like pyridoxal phosphate-dependent protein